jgi:hypothetical protein
MLVEKEVIRPGTYWYTDEATGLPRKLVVTPELTRYWHEQGQAMLSAGLTIPVPCEHDFNSHPMTPAEKLKNNAGWVKEYRLRDNVLFSAVDVTDDEIRKKLPHTIRWTSPWINSFTDGKGREWKNVISHLALTTRPRIVEQAPFGSVAAALSLATEVRPTGTALPEVREGFCLSRAGRLVTLKKSKRQVPRYPVAFSMWAGGIRLADDMPFMKKKKGAAVKEGETDTDEMYEDDENPSPAGGQAEGGADALGSGAPSGDTDMMGLMDPMQDSNGDVQMEELLCDLLQALGVPMPDESNENEFKRHLYEAAMSKIKELTSKGMGGQQPQPPDQNKPPSQQPNAAQPQQNPLIQQEQQPMFMSIEEINRLPDPMRGVALAMYTENQKLRGEMEASKKVTDSLRDAKLKEAAAARTSRVTLLGRLSPRVKADLDAMLALPAMALSMGDGGAVNDPMATTLAVLEKGLADMPRLLTTDASALSVVPQPQDADMLTDARSDEIADGLARAMGCPPVEQKKAG